MANGVAPEKPQVSLTADELRDKIIYQVEHYFGDYNLPKDKFLLAKIKENEGWIDMDVLLTFNRLKSLTTDKNVISEALKASTNNIVEVSEDNLKVRRNPEKPLPESFKQAFLDRTIYVKGFPREMTLDQLIEFFKPFKAGCIKMRRFSFNRQFKGSVFVLLETVEDAKHLRESVGLKYEDTELILMSAQEHAEIKAEEKKASETNNKNKRKNGDDESDELNQMAKVEETFQKMDKKAGVFLRLTGIPKESAIGFQDIKTFFTEGASKVAYVEFEKGQEEALLRFEEENGAKVAVEKLAKEGKVSIKETELSVKTLEGEEETTQYRKQAELKATRFDNDRNNRKRSGQNRQQGYRGKGGRRAPERNRRGGGGRGGNNGGGDGNEPESKRAKVDE